MEGSQTIGSHKVIFGYNSLLNKVILPFVFAIHMSPVMTLIYDPMVIYRGHLKVYQLTVITFIEFLVVVLDYYHSIKAFHDISH